MLHRRRLMQFSASIPALAAALATATLLGACSNSGHREPIAPVTATATVSGGVRSSTGAAIAGASVKIGSGIGSTDTDGRFTLQNLPVGDATIVTSAPRFEERAESIKLSEGTN